MKKEDVLRMAREAGVYALLRKEDFQPENFASFSNKVLVKFADAIRSATKEEDARICEQEAAFAGEGKKDAASLNCADAIRASK